MAPKTINKHDSSLVSGNVGDVRTSYTKIQIAIWIKAWVEIQISLLSHEIDLCKKSHLLYYTLPDKHTHFWDWIVPPTRLRFWTMEILCPPTSATTPKCEKKHRNLTAVARPTGAVTARAKLSWKCTHPFRTNSEGMQLAPNKNHTWTTVYSVGFDESAWNDKSKITKYVRMQIFILYAQMRQTNTSWFQLANDITNIIYK